MRGGFLTVLNFWVIFIFQSISYVIKNHTLKNVQNHFNYEYIFTKSPKVTKSYNIVNPKFK